MIKRDQISKDESFSKKNYTVSFFSNNNLCPVGNPSRGRILAIQHLPNVFKSRAAVDSGLGSGYY